MISNWHKIYTWLNVHGDTQFSVRVVASSPIVFSPEGSGDSHFSDHPFNVGFPTPQQQQHASP